MSSAEDGQDAEPKTLSETPVEIEPEKIKEKSKIHLIFSALEQASQADLPKYYKKPGRQRTEEQVRSIILYRLARKDWPAGVSEYMQWYYDSKYINVKGEYHAKVTQWRQESKEASTGASRGKTIYQLA